MVFGKDGIAVVVVDTVVETERVSSNAAVTVGAVEVVNNAEVAVEVERVVKCGAVAFRAS